MKLTTTILIGSAFATPTFGQVSDPCGPRQPVPLETTRTVNPNTQRTSTVAVGDMGDGRSLNVTYNNPSPGYFGLFQMTGAIVWTNTTAVAREYTYRQIIPLGANVIPMIPDGFSEVCFEPAKNRVVVVYTATIQPGQTVTEQIYWEITTRAPGQIADINGDGWVDDLDFAEMIGAINGQDSRYDLNGDGVVDSLDLDILINALSESWGDDDQAAADPPVDYSTSWASADTVIEIEVLTLPDQDVRDGHYSIPLTDWQWT